MSPRIALVACLLPCLSTAGAGPVFLDTEHAHVNVRYDGDVLQVEAEYDESGGTVRLPLGETVFVINSVARATLPSNLSPSFSFLGSPGDVVWRLRNTFVAGTLYFGISGYGTEPGSLASDRSTLQMTGYAGAGGHFYLYDSVGGVPTLHFDTRSGPPHGVFSVTSGSHYHPFVIFQRKGIHRVSLRASATRASDGAALLSEPAEALFLVEPTPYERWLAAEFASRAVEAITGPGDDPDADGLPNALEYALGGKPLAADARSVAPRVFLTGGPDAASQRLAIELRRAGDAVSDRSDLALRVEAGHPSGGWTVLDLGAQTVLPGPAPDADGVPRIQVLDTQSPAVPGGRFLRLVAELAP